MRTGSFRMKLVVVVLSVFIAPTPDPNSNYPVVEPLPPLGGDVGVRRMLFPVPPDANDIHVWQDDVELSWSWSEEEYPTILPEMPTIPMIEWPGPFLEEGVVFRVELDAVRALLA